MRIFQIARQRSQCLRVLLAVLLLAFAINSIADVTHQHDTATTPTQLCAYCATFGGLGDVPQRSPSLVTVVLVTVAPWSLAAEPIPRRHVTHVQPRGPPVFLKS
jgi:hypothetical protein